MGQNTQQKTFSQRQLRVGELVKQNLGELFIRNEAKIPSINSKLITVTEVRMTPDLKTARDPVDDPIIITSFSLPNFSETLLIVDIASYKIIELVYDPVNFFWYLGSAP